MMFMTLIWIHLKLDISNTGTHSFVMSIKSRKLYFNGFYIAFISIVYILYIIDIALIIKYTNDHIDIALYLIIVSNIIALIIIWMTGI